MGTSIMSSHPHLIHYLLLRSVPFSFSKSSLISSAAFSTSCFRHFRPNCSIFLTRQSPHRFRDFAPYASVSVSQSFSSAVSGPCEVEFNEEDDEIEDEDGSDYEGEVQIADFELEEESIGDGSQTDAVSQLSSSVVNGSEVKNLPSLTVKEKKELASYAHSLGKKLKTQLVGKSGVTPGLATSFVETLEANELLKIKILRNCPVELDDAVRQLEDSTGSVVVSQIGRTIIIYRPSITKMKSEEKKRQARKIYVRKEPDRVKSILQNKLQTPGISNSNRGRRGSSRF